MKVYDRNSKLLEIGDWFEFTTGSRYKITGFNLLTHGKSYLRIRIEVEDNEKGCVSVEETDLTMGNICQDTEDEDKHWYKCSKLRKLTKEEIMIEVI